ncbi:MAG: formate--tetrahydrofolate ligase [Sulfuricurvum sp.]|uniref:formate--tetrahydrofolate ligase n=1 Tax=Sulfuricurvum sp. TaxID=2025608 RepID=UPI0025D1FAC4|nr:formate--tetrahydrofolate ligase [Sulfuricurvum sp.]MBV5320221.1 formate--tetrahydrofolate ligase [Sulfuricurvum sp.]
MSDIEIAQHAKMKPIIKLAEESYGIPFEQLDPYGHYKAKLSLEYIESLSHQEREGKLILVSAISPTPAGEGKTTTTVGLGDAMNRLGKKTIICLREPSLGPCFGLKGGAAGGGYSQVVPMEDINLHFTGDFHAIGVAHNLLAAMIDNHIHHGNALEIDSRRIKWKRVVDMNDRALREITIGQGGAANGYLREDGFDIVVASEVMAILCLAVNRADLKERLGRIIVAYKSDKSTPIYASDLKAHGAMAAVLKDAIKPNLVQTLENNIAIVHGGPFANIAHGCNSVMATKTALKLADYVVTEAGFGADLGAEKFLNIKCRSAKLAPSVVVLVATVRALKYHGGIEKDHLNQENMEALEVGFANLERHISNIQTHYGLPVVVSLNHFTFDTDGETALVQEKCRSLGVKCIVSKHWAEGGKGAEALAQEVADIVDGCEGGFNYLYDSKLPLWEKIKTVATKIYGARDITASAAIRDEISKLQEHYGELPVCIAKTQMSFSTNPNVRGAPVDHTVEISGVKVENGAGFIVAIAGNMMTMPGLPKVPTAEHIDIDDNGVITGLF